MQYLIPALLAFAFAFILWQIQRKKVQLDYEIIKSDSFPRENGEGQYFIIRLRNSGNTIVEKTNLKISFSVGTIESKTYSNPELIEIISESETEISGFLPLLNPKEIFSTTITMFGKGAISSPEVTARAPGTTATVKNDTANLPYVLNTLIAISIGVTIAVAFSVYSSYRTSKVTASISQIENLGELSERINTSNEGVLAKLQKQNEIIEEENKKRREEWEREEKETEQGKPKTEQLIFAIFNRSGLSHRFPDLVGSAEEIQYWKTGLFLLTSFLTDEKYRDKYISAAEVLIDINEMAPSSRGFNLYLLAKMEQYQGNKEKAIKWLEMCQKTTPLMYEHLMIQDTAFDIEKLREYLLSKESSR